jgi:microsomal epoxide hydrolase
MTSSGEPFRVAIPDSALDDLRRRLLATRWPDQLPGRAWEGGTDLGYLRDLCSYWADGFKWRKVEARLNSWPQFHTVIDGQRIHYIHARSKHATATPVVLLHGWPGSVLEFLDVLDPLTDPTAHGGRVEDAFHVVCVSLPGFTFSGPTTEPGWHCERMASAVLALMSALGYARFGAQGGDWGSVVASCLAAKAPDAVIGLHINFVLHSGPSPEDGEPTEQERHLLEELEQHLSTGVGYQTIQKTKPQTLAYGLADSPAGLAGWIVEKYHAWTDHDDDLESVLHRDVMLANITAYWVTETINSSMRIYYETERAGLSDAPHSIVTVPTACALFPHELYRPSHRWAERRYSDIRRWTEFPSGGHFAALENPEALVSELRVFFGSLTATSRNEVNSA